jgi:hypothetical protein
MITHLVNRKTLLQVYAYYHLSGRQDEIVSLMTEKRHVTDPKYGWCGDAATYALEFSGSRSSSLNRVSINGSWEPSRNITKLMSGAGTPMFRGDGQPIRPGDFIVQPRKDGDHIGVFIASMPRLRTLLRSDELDLLLKNKRESKDVALKVVDLVTRGPYDGEISGGDGVRDSSGALLDYVTIDGNGQWSKIWITLRRVTERNTPFDTRVMSVIRSERLWSPETSAPRLPSPPEPVQPRPETKGGNAPDRGTVLKPNVKRNGDVALASFFVDINCQQCESEEK